MTQESQETLFNRIGRCVAGGLEVGVAVGAFGLIHAGTVDFLRRSREEVDRLFVAVLPYEILPGIPAQAKMLLRPDERRRILGMMNMVDGVGLLAKDDIPGQISQWHEAAPSAPWFSAEEEADLDMAIVSRLATLGHELRWLPDTVGCTTGILVERLAR